MSKARILLIIFFLATAVSANAMRKVPRYGHQQSPPSAWNHERWGKKQPVGAPLDGGLLTILGAAGMGYYAARKKKNNSTV